MEFMGFVKPVSYTHLDANRIQELSAKASDYFQKRFPSECDNDRFRSHISAVEENFDRFVLKKDRMVFYFPQGTLFEMCIRDRSLTYQLMKVPILADFFSLK